MSKLIPFRDSDFEKAFIEIAGVKNAKPYITEIVNAIIEDCLDEDNFIKILKVHTIGDVSDIKEDALDLILMYITYILDDGIITNKELANLEVFKMLFKIEEGDFYRLRHDEVREILNEQFKKIYKDNMVDQNEAVLKVGLQKMFDLGYDQFLELSQNEVKAALERGADLNNLDTVINLSVYKNHQK